MLQRGQWSMQQIPRHWSPRPVHAVSALELLHRCSIAGMASRFEIAQQDAATLVLQSTKPPNTQVAHSNPAFVCHPESWQSNIACKQHAMGPSSSKESLRCSCNSQCEYLDLTWNMWQAKWAISPLALMPDMPS